MVGITAANSRESVASILDSLSFASEIPSKLELLRQLRAELSRSDTVLLSEFLSHLLKLLSDQFSPVRKLVIEVIGDVGSNSLELLPEIIPRLMPVVDDDTPAVARQAINTATELFKFTLQKVGIQGLHSSELDDSLESAWACMMKLKEKLYSVAFQRGSDGRKLIALKFVVAVILLYTPDPSGSAEPPAGQNNEEKVSEFNMSWVRRGHPLLKVGDLSVEASQSSGLLLDQLRYPTVKSLGVSSIIVLINCVSAVAKKRPSFYGRILPALLGLDPSNLATEGVHLYALQHALKKAFISCLECTHSSSTPWRDRLVGALRELKAEGYSDQVVEVNTVNGKVENGDRSTPVPKEEPALTDEIFNELNMMKGRKRSGDQELGETSEGGDTPGKRLRSASADSEVSPQQLKNAIIGEESTTQKPTSEKEVDFGPVQQLVGVFAALVAQGDKAAASLEILISSISADLLAEVVMCNMRNLSDHCPKLKDSESPDNIASHTSMPERDSQFRQLSVFIENMFSSCGSAKVGSEMDVDPPTYKVEMGHVEESPSVAEHENYAMVSATDGGAGEKITPPSSPCASGAGSYVQVSKGYSAPTTVFQDVNEDSGIPGLDGVPSDGYKDAMTSSSLVSTDVDETSQDQAISVGKRIQVDSLPSLSAERSDESGLRAVATEVSSGMKSTATSLASTYQLVLPKMAAPFVDLTDEEKDEIQKASFTRIVEAYKQVSTAGGTELQFSLLAYLAVKFPSDLDPWILVQKQVLSDYVNNEGHELTLRVLYKLYGEAEEEHDFFSSTTATSVYEMFLLKVAETLHDSLPPSDKSLSRLLAEVPYLPKTICEFLGRLCCPESTDADDKESQSGDRVTQGLSTVWSLILSRPPHRDVLLQIALQSAVHHLDEVRMKAIRLVANKLYPVASIAHQIEEFAKQRLLSVTNITDADAENCNLQSQKSCDTTSSSTEQLSHDAMTKNQSSNAHQSSMSENVSNTLIASARRSMSLYFALCTKKHSLLRQIFIIYESSPLHVKQAIHSQMPMLVRTVGTSPMLLEIISNPPEGSLDILMKVMHTLTDGMHPSPELINTIKKLYELKGKDIEILFPILSFLPKDEVISAFNRLFHLSPQKFQGALNRVLQGSASSAPVLTPEEVLIAIHGIDPEKEKVPLKKVTDACNACFEQRQIFTQQVIAKVLNQLVEQTPLPLLFMRTVLQAIGAFPALVDFIMGILSRLVNKQIWKYPKLWVGFLKCAQLTQPHSFSILLQLPPSQLEGALNKIPALRTPLTSHASQPDVKSTLPRSILVVLGLATDSQPTNQEQAAATPAEDSAHAKGSENDAISEKLKESPSVG